MFATSGEKAERVPVCAAVVTLVQPQPPGTQVATLETNTPSVPLSKPSLTGVLHRTGRAGCGGGGRAGDRRRVASAGVPVTVGVGVPTTIETLSKSTSWVWVVPTRLRPSVQVTNGVVSKAEW